MVLGECLSHSGTELVPYTTTLPQVISPVYIILMSNDISEFLRSKILILSHGASYLKTLYVLSTHSNYTALQFSLKKAR